jgi:SAM-dependent methyltransferase
MNRSVRRRSSVSYYGAEANRLAARYDSVTFDDVHLDLLADLPAPGARVLDVGSGSGRDALALAHRGYKVTAVEPAAALRRHAREADQLRQVRWVDDRLPNLRRLRAEPDRFDFILCSAVMMHLTPAELIVGFSSFEALLKPNGIVAISLRDPYPDDPPSLFFAHSTDDVVNAAGESGLVVWRQAEPPDVLGRALQWRTLVFTRSLCPHEPTKTSASVRTASSR